LLRNFREVELHRVGQNRAKLDRHPKSLPFVSTTCGEQDPRAYDHDRSGEAECDRLDVHAEGDAQNKAGGNRFDHLDESDRKMHVHNVAQIQVDREEHRQRKLAEDVPQGSSSMAAAKQAKNAVTAW
jgi:hypothetical protein